MNEKIGTMAGAVWTALKENGVMTVKDLKKATKAKTEKELFMAIGWLLREDKLNVEEDEKNLSLSLK